MDEDRRFPLGWLVLTLVVAAGATGLYLYSHRLEQRDARVTVVDAKAPTPASDMPSPTVAPTPVQSRVATPELAAAHAMRTYPMLTDVRITCADDRCTLNGMIRPPSGGQAELDKRQEMLLGGLAAVLASDGYRLVVPFKMDEVDFNRFRLTADVVPQRS